MKRLLSTLPFFVLLAAGLFSLASCEKNNDDYVLNVIVTVNNETRVSNATIRVYAPVSNRFDDLYYTTNENGEVSFTFSNEIVVDVIATKGSYKTCSFSRIEEGNNTLVVNLEPWASPYNGCDN